MNPWQERRSKGCRPLLSVDFSYPVLDLVLMGAILGVYGLLGWRPDGMWILLGLGILATTAADATFAVQEAHGLANDRPYDFVWTLGALLIACAAWATSSPKDAWTEVTGLRAIALVLAAQVLAAGLQIYALFGELGKSERIVTLMVLAVTSVQVVLARPRAKKSCTVSEPSTSAIDLSVAFHRPMESITACPNAIDVRPS